MEYQYLMENLILRQVVSQTSGETNINVVGLKIRNDESRFQSDNNWISSMRSLQSPEIFMLQDFKRQNGKNVCFTVYNAIY